MFFRRSGDGGRLRETFLEAEAFVAEWNRALAGRWMVEIDDMSRHQVPMLDLIVYKSPDHLVCWLPHFKPTALMVPLTARSSHPVHVHGWPISEAMRIAKHSTSRKHMTYVLGQFQAAWTRFGIDREIIRRTRTIGPLGLRFLEESNAREARNVDDDSQVKIPWLVLPWHPLMTFARVSREANRVLQRWKPHLESEGVQIRKIGVAWRSGSRPLHQLLRARHTRADFEAEPFWGWMVGVAGGLVRVSATAASSQGIAISHHAFWL